MSLRTWNAILVAFAVLACVEPTRSWAEEPAAKRSLRPSERIWRENVILAPPEVLPVEAPAIPAGLWERLLVLLTGSNLQHVGDGGVTALDTLHVNLTLVGVPIWGDSPLEGEARIAPPPNGKEPSDGFGGVFVEANFWW